MSGTNHTITTLTAAALAAAVGKQAIVLSRKNDGVQLRYADGEFTTRSGAVLNAPHWWKEQNSAHRAAPGRLHCHRRTRRSVRPERTRP